jgi:hypothetical protein
LIPQRAILASAFGCALQSEWQILQCSWVIYGDCLISVPVLEAVEINEMADDQHQLAGRGLWLGGGVCWLCRKVKELKANQSYRWEKGVGLV